MKLKHDGLIYDIEFFFGKTGEPKKLLDETTPCVRTTNGESFLCAECEFLPENEVTEETDKDFLFYD
jgi:hypothetical protein